MSRKEPEQIKVGMGATQQVGSDRYPFTVIEIKSPKKIVVQGDIYRRTDKNGQSESQTYEFERNFLNAKITLTKRNDGVWRRMGESKKAPGFYIGKRDCYFDPSF
jgi:hypothetical protein